MAVITSPTEHRLESGDAQSRYNRANRLFLGSSAGVPLRLEPSNSEESIARASLGLTVSMRAERARPASDRAVMAARQRKAKWSARPRGSARPFVKYVAPAMTAPASTACCTDTVSGNEEDDFRALGLQYGDVQTSSGTDAMSARGTFRTSHCTRRMSVIGGKADMTRTGRYVANDP